MLSGQSVVVVLPQQIVNGIQVDSRICTIIYIFYMIGRCRHSDSIHAPTVLNFRTVNDGQSFTKSRLTSALQTEHCDRVDYTRSVMARMNNQRCTYVDNENLF